MNRVAVGLVGIVAIVVLATRKPSTAECGPDLGGPGSPWGA